MCLAIEQMKQESEAIGEARGEAKGKAIGEAIGEARGEARGEVRGRMKALFELVAAGLLTAAQAAENAKLTEDQFKQEMAKAKV